MTRTRSRSVRALSGALSLALALTGLTMMAASPAAAAPAVVYDSMPAVQPASYPSLGFQAQATHEFGDYVLLGGSNRVITDVTISFTSWACETGQWNLGDCVTTPGATFTHPITMNLYEANNAGGVPVVGDLIASVTQDVVAPYRPTPNAEKCAQSSGSRPWWDEERNTCQNGLAFDVSFDFSGDDALVGNDVIVTVAYNTGSYGAAPTGNTSGPENALNVSINNLLPPFVGVDENAAEMIRDTTFSGSTRGLKTSTLISTSNGLVMEITADSVPAINPLADVTVYERDLGDYSASLTLAEYLEWHEGNPLAGDDGSVVLEDGLHLGLVSASTVIKGIDASQPSSVVTRAQLRQLIERASVDVESGSVTYQVPIFFGSPTSPTFTTLRSTSLTAGTSTFDQADTWATTRAFGPYGAQETAPLGELINAVFDAAAAAGGGVALAGFGVQADADAVVSQVVWDGTRYTFTQPVIETCVPTDGGVITNVDLASWTFTDTRSQGVNEFVEGGLRVETFDNEDGSGPGSPDQRKAAGYHPIDIALSEVGTPALEIAPGFTGVRPSLQLGFDADGNGTRDAYLVGEPWAYGGGDWSPTVNGDWADAKYWVTGSNGFGVAPGAGYPALGTLDEYLLANPEARITNYGYSLGSGVVGEAVITSITVGCETTTFEFELETLAPPVTDRLAGNDRFTTAVEISKNSFPDGTTAVFIATGTTFADALSAAPAATSVDAPLLLTDPAGLPPAVAAEITRLDPTQVFIIGGTGAVSAAVENSIRALDVTRTITRIEGIDRYATSRAIADQFWDDVTELFVATGADYPDALAAGPAAAQVGGPVVLVPGAASAVDGPTLALLSSLTPTTVYVAGGASVVSTGIETQLDGLTGVAAVRLAGIDRIATAIAINDEVFGVTTDAYLATGSGFADALAGGAAAGSRSAPLYLTGASCVPPSVLASITLRGASQVYVLGGAAVLSESVLNLVPCT